MKVSLNQIESDLIQLCEDNTIMIEVIKTYFKEYENKDDKILDLKDEGEEECNS